MKGNRRWLIIGGLAAALIVVCLCLAVVIIGALVIQRGSSAQSNPQKMAEAFFDRINQQDIEGARELLCLGVPENSYAVIRMYTLRDEVKKGRSIVYRIRGVEKTNVLGTTYAHVYLDLSPIFISLPMGLGTASINGADVTVKQTDAKWCIENLDFR